MAGCNTKRMKAGGKIKKEDRARMGASTNLPAKSKMGKPSKSKTALERTSPKSAAKQKGLAARNMLRDELGSKLDDPSFRVEMGGKEVTGLKKGGCVGDGICKKGRTKGRMV